MKNKALKIPAIIIAIGIILSVAAYLLASIKTMPAVTEPDFDYSITYRLGGETKTINCVYTSRFSRFGNAGINPLERYYDGEYTVDGAEASRCYTIAQKDTVELYIVATFNDSYLMGDTKHVSYGPLEAPYLEAVDSEGYSYDSDGAELLSMFDAEIVSWEYPEPIENTFVFAGIAGLHSGNTLAMIVVGILTLILCMIFVKKGEGVEYSVLDKLGIALNFVAMFFALPILYLSSVLIQAYPTGPDWIYQAYLCIPQIFPFSVAASVSLRRKGFRKSGFFIQFLAPALLVIVSIFEYVL